MRQQLARETLAELTQSKNVASLSFAEIVALARAEIDGFLPDGTYQIDPRNGDRILYHSSRARRPHDNVPAPPEAEPMERECLICQGNTTGIIDVAELSEGFTFINENLFPILYPFGKAVGHGVAQGLHLLQWTSSQHAKDWHNMPLADCVVVMDRLAVLERKLLEGCGELPAPEGVEDRPQGEGCFVVIIKNYGHLVGGSLIHGHQQIAFSSVMPRHFRDNRRFQREHGETFSAHMLRENPSDLVVKDYGAAVLVVPYFMRRPYDMMLLVRDTAKRYLHELDEVELTAAAEAWHDAIRAIRDVMPKIGRQIAYNVITNNGPGAGLYFEFLPYTQEIGGVEHLGLFVCQELPGPAAARLREILNE